MTPRLPDRVLRSLLLAALLATSGLIGCHSDNSGLTDAQQQTGDRLGEIAKKSGGDWEKVSPEDRKYLLDNVAHGNEHTARMLIAPPPGAGGPGGAGPAGGPVGMPKAGAPSGR